MNKSQNSSKVVINKKQNGAKKGSKSDKGAIQQDQQKEIPDEPIAKRTRSRAQPASSWFVMIIALMAIITGVFGNECNYTKFAHNPGLFFEKSGQMTLTSDKWNIVCVAKLGHYYAQIGSIGILLYRLDELCKEIL